VYAGVVIGTQERQIEWSVISLVMAMGCRASATYRLTGRWPDDFATLDRCARKPCSFDALLMSLPISADGPPVSRATCRAARISSFPSSGCLEVALSPTATFSALELTFAHKKSPPKRGLE